MPGDLLWVPPLCKELGDKLAEIVVGVDAARVIPPPASRRLAVGIKRPVPTAAAGLAAQLARDSRRSASQPGCDLPDAQAGVTQVGHLDPLLLGQEPWADLTNREPFQRRHEADHRALAVRLVATGPVAAGGPVRRPPEPRR